MRRRSSSPGTERVLIDAMSQYAPSEHDVAPYYSEARARLYDYAPSGRNIWQAEIYFLKPLFNSGPKSVLDIACGNGNFLRNLAEQTENEGPMIGVDKQQGHVDTALLFLQQEPRPSDAQVSFMQADANALPFHHSTFDVVTMNFLAYHVPDPGRAIGQAARVLKPGGTLIVGSRDEVNQAKVLEHARITAKALGLQPPVSPYPHCDIATTHKWMRNTGYSNGRAALDVQPLRDIWLQDEPLEVPIDKFERGDEAGWEDWRHAVMSMHPYMKDRFGNIPGGEWGEIITAFVDSEIKRLFYQEYGKRMDTGRGFVEDRVRQGFIVATKLPRERSVFHDLRRLTAKAARLITSHSLKGL